MHRQACVLLLALLGVLAHAESADIDFGYAQLLEIVRKHDVRSVEQLMPLLPDEFQRNITFRLEPHNRLQKGVRAIRFTDNGRLMLTHSDRGDVKGGHSIEIYETPRKGSQQLHFLEFDPEGKTPPYISDRPKAHKQTGNPESCVACHGDPPRKIWPAYNKWPDACGAEDDEADEKCLRFLAEAKKNKRFADLKWDPNNSAWPYYTRQLEKCIYGPGGCETKKIRTLKTMPNTRLSYLVQIQNAEQMAQTIEDSKLFPQVKYTLLDLGLCEPQDAHLSRIRTALTRSRQFPLPANWHGNREEYIDELLQKTQSHSSVDDHGTRIYHRITTVPNPFIELLGVKLGNTGANEQIQRGGYTGIGFSPEAINASSAEYLTAQLLRGQATNDPVIASALQRAGQDNLLSDRFYQASAKFIGELKGVFFNRSQLTSLCFHLRRKSIEELNALEKSIRYDQLCEQNRSFELAPVSGRSLESLVTIAKSADEVLLDKGRSLLHSEKCIACHESHHGDTVGPSITFSDASKFAAQNVNAEYTDGRSLVDLSKSLMAHSDREQRMPLNHPALHADDQAAIVRYLTHMASRGTRQSSGK